MGFVRIIAGSLRGRRIPVLERPGLRPTADRVREALFSILAARIENASVLDAYSGSGALGLEALSRGARSVTFLEADSEAARGILDVAKRFGVQAATTVITGPVVPTLACRVGKDVVFDLILADPPYGGTETGAFLRCASNHLERGGLLVLERDLRDDPASVLPPGLERTRTVRYGRTCLDFFTQRAELALLGDAGD